MRAMAIVSAFLILFATGCDLRIRRRPAPPAPPAPAAPARPSAESVEAAAWEEVESKSAALVASQQFGGALRLLDAERAFHPKRAERVAALKEAALAAAQARAADLERLAREAIDRGDAAAADAAWKAELELDVTDISDRARASMQEGAALLHAKQHAVAQPFMRPVLLELQRLLLARDDRATREFLARSIAEHPELRLEVDWLRGTVIEADGVFKAVEAGLNLMKDTEVTIGTESVTVVGATAETASFRRASGNALEMPLSEVPPGLFLKAALRAGHTADFVGQFLLFTGRLAEARAAFKGLHRPDLDTLADSVERTLAEPGK